MDNKTRVAKAKVKLYEISGRIDKGRAYLQGLQAKAGGQYTPEYERLFAEWQRLLDREAVLMDEIERAGG